MKLTLKEEWRPKALASFVWFIDIKTGVKIVLLFAMLNKVAGLYGLIAMLVGAGGSFLQISMYLYSVLGLAAYAWGLKATAEESPTKSLTTAHFFLVDHLLSTVWTVLLAIDWWVYNLHDGQRPPLSQVQQDIIDVGPGKSPVTTPDELKGAVQEVWNKEKGTAAGVIVLGWLVKFYFAALIYSYALHLRKGTYRSLPVTHAASHSQRAAAGDDTAYHPLYENELDATQDLEADGMWDVRSSMAHGDIDFDAEDWDGPQHVTDVERGRRARGVGQVLSVGGYGESQQQKATGSGSSRVANGGGSKRTSPRVMPSKPIASSPLSPRPQPSRTNTQQRIVSPSKQQDKEKSRAAEIQRELEHLGSPKAADWGDEDAEELSAATHGRTERLKSVTSGSPRRGESTIATGAAR